MEGDSSTFKFSRTALLKAKTSFLLTCQIGKSSSLSGGGVEASTEVYGPMGEACSSSEALDADGNY